MGIKIIKSNADKENINALLNEFYFLRPDSYGLMEREQIYYEQYAHIIKKYLNQKNPSLLDVGSGSYRIPMTIANTIKNFEKIVSLDFYSEEKLDEYNKYLDDKKIKLVKLENNKYPFEDNSFDFVSSLCVFEHIIFVEDVLFEIKRVLKPGGKILIMSPNWSGINSVLHGIKSVIFKNDRYWRYESFSDILKGILNIPIFYLKIILHKNPIFFIIEPRIKNNKINFERSDDDAVHLCHPLSFKKWFKKNNFKIIKYNRFNGKTKLSKIFNTLFPSFSTTNFIIAEKRYQ